MAFSEKTHPFSSQKGLHIKAVRDACTKNWQRPIYEDVSVVIETTPSPQISKITPIHTYASLTDTNITKVAASPGAGDRGGLPGIGTALVGGDEVGERRAKGERAADKKFELQNNLLNLKTTTDILNDTFNNEMQNLENQ